MTKIHFISAMIFSLLVLVIIVRPAGYGSHPGSEVDSASNEQWNTSTVTGTNKEIANVSQTSSVVVAANKANSGKAKPLLRKKSAMSSESENDFFVVDDSDNTKSVRQVAKTKTIDKVLYLSDFDNVMNDWKIDNEVWHLGSPVFGPHDLCGTTSTCLGTVMDGTYPDDTNATLTSPEISLPLLSPDESVSLRFINWFDIDKNDAIKVSITMQYSDGEWSRPETLSIQSGKQTEWQDYELDLSRYEGETIKLNFDLIQKSDKPGTGAGWMLNDIQILQTS